MRTVHFHLRAEDLAVFNRKGKWVVEPETFELMVGGSSDQIQGIAKFVVDRPVALQ